MAGSENDAEIVQKAFLTTTENFLKHGASFSDLQSIALQTDRGKKSRNFLRRKVFSKKTLVCVIVPILCAVFIKSSYVDVVARTFYETRCFIPNNYLVWEFSRPVSDCSYCQGVEAALILPNLTKEEFQLYSYTSRPVIVKEAAKHWRASEVFDLKFFVDLYELVDGAYEAVEEECQFLHFKSNFNSLREAFAMSERRALNEIGEEPWYIGWKNCHPRVLDAMSKFYDAPHFLPDDAEIPYTNYVFLGYGQGAVMHLDYISRLMWQGQVLGSKTWTVAPTPECEHACKRFSFSVECGDIVLLDTRIWYHSTDVENGGFSLTVTSEYG